MASIKSKILFIIMIIFISCSSQPTPIETFQIHPILDPQLNQIKQNFLHDANHYGITGLEEKYLLLLLVYDTLPEPFWGLCFHDAGFIYIDSSRMKSDSCLIQIVTYHELSHFYLKLDHADSTHLDIMMPIISPEQADSMCERFIHYKRNLFKSYFIRKRWQRDSTLVR